MAPDEPDNRRVGTPLIPQRPLLHTPESVIPERQSTQEAAAQLVRDQINTIYSADTTPVAAQPLPQQPSPQPTTAAPITQSDLTITNPYDRTHTTSPQPQAEQWKQYHSAWQSYYQKYYERYYVSKVHEAHQALMTHVQRSGVSSSQPVAGEQPAVTNEASDTSFRRDEALRDLREMLRSRINSTAIKARQSRHFVPIGAAIAVVLLFSLLQYNRVLIANVQAYVMPGNADPQSIIVDPNLSENVGPDSKLIIPKINVNVPAFYGVGSDYNSQMAAMANGVAHFCIPGACSVPGQIGNTVLAGHSSNDILDSGDYKFIFVQLDKLTVGDTVYANYQGKRYTYTVTKKEVVQPTDVNKLVYSTSKPVITLITCTPIGTALKRLLVTAEQVSPNPDTTATAAPADPSGGTAASANIPGNSPTFMERIFGGGSN